MTFLVDPVVQLIGLGGGLAGLFSLYLHWEKRQKKVKISNSFCQYSATVNEDKTSSNLDIVSNLTIYNGTDEPISVTDVIGTMKYNKEKLIGLTNSQPGLVFSSEATNAAKELPKLIGPKEAAVLPLLFKFNGIVLSAVDRACLLRFMGFRDGVPFFFASVVEFKANWDKHPLQLQVSTHLNCDKVVKTVLPAYPKETSERQAQFQGSLGVVDIAEIQRDFLKL